MSSLLQWYNNAITAKLIVITKTACLALVSFHTIFIKMLKDGGMAVQKTRETRAVVYKTTTTRQDATRQRVLHSYNNTMRNLPYISF